MTQRNAGVDDTPIWECDACGDADVLLLGGPSYNKVAVWTEINDQHFCVRCWRAVRILEGRGYELHKRKAAAA